MERLCTEKLNLWFESKNRKPLIIWGARQVGKTYLVTKLFAEKKFKEYVYIDLQKDDDARSFFSTTCDPAKYLKFIEIKFGKTISNSCPLIFDEVQTCNNVLTSLKYFNQDFPELPVIATGSLVRLSIQHNNSDNFLFPVGKIDSINVYPLTFEEFLLNTNKPLLEKIKSCFYTCSPLESYEHGLALDKLYEYLMIGGMPEALSVYFETGSFPEARQVLGQIYDNYIADMDQYSISQETIIKTRKVYRNIFSQLNKTNKNFKVSQIEHGKSNRDYFNSYQWLQEARVIYRCNRKSDKVSLPLIENEEDSGLFRLYLSDVGLFAYQSQTNAIDFYVKDKRNTLSGVFFENYVACELSSKNIALFFWEGKSSSEFEFLIQTEEGISPIDVKKKSGSLNSLSHFRAFNKRTKAIKISANNFGFDQDNNILTIPLYSVFALTELK